MRAQQGGVTRKSIVDADTFPARGTGSRSRRFAEGQWSQQRYIGTYLSQFPSFDRLREDTPFLTLFNNTIRGDRPEQYALAISQRQLVVGNPTQTPGIVIPSGQETQSLGVGTAQLQLRIEYSLGGGIEQRLDVDVGAGFQISVPATSLRVLLALSEGSSDISSSVGQLVPVGPPDPVSGVETAFASVLLFCNLSRMSQFSSLTDWQLTRIIDARTGVGRVPIPPGADEVEVFGILGTQAPALSFVTDNLDNAVQQFENVGVLNFNLNTPSRTGSVRIPGTAAFIEAPAAAGLFSAVFRQRP